MEFKAKYERVGGLENEIKPNLCKNNDERPIWARGLCKSCYDKWLKENNPKFLENQKNNVKKWMDTHKASRKKYMKNWRAKQDPLYNRIRKLRTYGMTIEDYDKMLEKQNGVCAVCKNPPKSGKSLHVDHDHTTGLVRGLLCFRCNFGLSYYKEDKQIIENLYKYISKPTIQL